MIPAVFFINTVPHIYASENTPVHNTREKQDVSENDTNNFKFTSFGIQTGVVLKEELDAGLGFGIRLTQPIIKHVFDITTTGYFWGASRDSLDVSRIGIEESLKFKKEPHTKVSLFSGVTVGYYATLQQIEITDDATVKTTTNKTNSFEAFITFGITYMIDSKRSFFTQINYGITQDLRELHIVTGIDFYK